MSSRFTAGFETLHARGLKDKKKKKSSMFGNNSTLSRGTQRLVEKLARQSKLNRHQMRALGSLASAGRNTLQSAPGRISFAPSMALQRPAHTLPYQDRVNQVHRMRAGRHRPSIKLKDSIDKEVQKNPIDFRGGLRVAAQRATNEAVKREASKWSLQNSYLGDAAVSAMRPKVELMHRNLVAAKARSPVKAGSSGSAGLSLSPKTLSPRVKRAAKARGSRRQSAAASSGLQSIHKKQQQEASALFADISREIEDRTKHMNRLRAMGVANVQKEAEMLAQIESRKAELETLDKMLSNF